MDGAKTGCYAKKRGEKRTQWRFALIGSSLYPSKKIFSTVFSIEKKINERTDSSGRVLKKKKNLIFIASMKILFDA